MRNDKRPGIGVNRARASFLVNFTGLAPFARPRIRDPLRSAEQVGQRGCSRAVKGPDRFRLAAIAGTPDQPGARSPAGHADCPAEGRRCPAFANDLDADTLWASNIPGAAA